MRHLPLQYIVFRELKKILTHSNIDQNANNHLRPTLFTKCMALEHLSQYAFFCYVSLELNFVNEQVINKTRLQTL